MFGEELTGELLGAGDEGMDDGLASEGADVEAVGRTTAGVVELVESDADGVASEGADEGSERDEADEEAVGSETTAGVVELIDSEADGDAVVPKGARHWEPLLGAEDMVDPVTAL
jgi:hypothetical protein